MPARPSSHWPTTIGYYALFVAIGLETASLGPTLPGLAGQTQTQLDAISFLFTAHALGYMLGSFFGGRAYDRLNGHPVMVAMLVLMAAMLVVIPLLPVLWVLAAAWLVLGVTGGALDVGGNTLLVWVHGRQVGPFMNGLHFFFGVGSFLSPIIIALAIQVSGGIRWAYWMLALLVLPTALWLVRLPSPSPRPATGERAPATGGFPAQPRPEAGRGQAGARRIVRPGHAVLISLLLLLYVGAEAAFGGWIYTYAVALDLSDATTAAYLVSAFWGALTVGRLLAVPLAARYRPRSLLLADLAGCLASVAVLLLWSSSPAATWLGALGLGLSMASIFPTAITLAERRITITGQVTGWFLVSGSMGAMLLPWLIGQLFESAGPQITMIVILVDLIAAVGVLAGLLSLEAGDGQRD
jgi:FHS family Na+ dependent glucose MFS transporter 1